ncbi:hypothetical protein EYF80_013223 [Liparis tanakae]|uniref:Uncharacterized protein n=1 Tax=Liparis tanakae TaxID=230148 RepID=A0A4Z2IHC2_9TELE|nr:hypothetical protein EYF80_013223 [Liparis tanakae]
MSKVSLSFAMSLREEGGDSLSRSRSESGGVVFPACEIVGAVAPPLGCTAPRAPSRELRATRGNANTNRLLSRSSTVALNSFCPPPLSSHRQFLSLGHLSFSPPSPSSSLCFVITTKMGTQCLIKAD